MTQLEFDEWLEYHCTAFSGLREWVDKQGDEVIRIWYRAVKRVSLKGAKTATDTMVSDEDLQPRQKEYPVFSRHPSVVFKVAKKNGHIEMYRPRQQQFDGERSYTCAHCLDTGFRDVYSAEAMRAMRDGAFTWIHRRSTCIAGCDCGWGDTITKTQELVPFDARKMVWWDFADERGSLIRLAAFFGVDVPELSPPPRYERPKPANEKIAPPATVGTLLKALGVKQASAEPPKREMTPQEVNGILAEYDEPWTPDMDLPF